jgi:hypothetical protein
MLIHEFVEQWIILVQVLHNLFVPSIVYKQDVVSVCLIISHLETFIPLNYITISLWQLQFKFPLQLETSSSS